MEEVASHDHTDADCIFVAVLSHGEMGILYAQDQPFKPDRLWCHFNAEKCPTLAGKPKLFFIQACQGDQVNMQANQCLQCLQAKQFVSIANQCAINANILKKR